MQQAVNSVGVVIKSMPSHDEKQEAEYTSPLTQQQAQASSHFMFEPE
jgi:hypothetical protein